MKGWYSYRYSRVAGPKAKADPWKRMLKALRKPKGEKPRKSSLIQMYLSASIDRVNEIYEVREPTDRLTGIRLRTVIAEELFAKEPEDVQQEWRDRVEEEYEDALEKHQEAKTGEPSDDPEAQAE